MPLKMHNSQSLTENKIAPKNIKHIIGVAAGKGGVGKSSLTVNLALALSQKGLNIGVLDADVYGPSIRMMLPEEQFPSMRGTTIFPALSFGIKTISVAYFRKDNEASAVRAPIANSLIQQFLNGVDWGELDILLIDFPPGTGDVQLTLSQKAQLSGALIVTTPQEISLLDVRKAVHLFNELKVPILGIVENMSYYLDEKSGERIHLFGKGGGEKLSKEAGVPFLGEIPLDPMIGKCLDRGEALLFKNDQKAEGAKNSFLTLAEDVLRHLAGLKEEAEGALKHFQLIWRDM